MEPNQSIDIKLSAQSGAPLRIGNVLVEVHFFQRGQYRYGFKVGRTDDMGRLRVSYVDIDRLRRDDAQENLMDYNTPLDDCDQDVEVVVPSDHRLREQVENVFRVYQQRPTWADNWPANIKIAPGKARCRLEGEVTSVPFATVLANETNARETKDIHDR